MRKLFEMFDFLCRHECWLKGKGDIGGGEKIEGWEDGLVIFIHTFVFSVSWFIRRVSRVVNVRASN